MTSSARGLLASATASSASATASAGASVGGIVRVRPPNPVDVCTRDKNISKVDSIIFSSQTHKRNKTVQGAIRQYGAQQVKTAVQKLAHHSDRLKVHERSTFTVQAGAQFRHSAKRMLCTSYRNKQKEALDTQSHDQHKLATNTACTQATVRGLTGLQCAQGVSQTQRVREERHREQQQVRRICATGRREGAVSKRNTTEAIRASKQRQRQTASNKREHNTDRVTSRLLASRTTNLHAQAPRSLRETAKKDCCWSKSEHFAAQLALTHRI